MLVVMGELRVDWVVNSVIVVLEPGFFTCEFLLVELELLAVDQFQEGAPRNDQINDG
jgi:hypothetical protein